MLAETLMGGRLRHKLCLAACVALSLFLSLPALAGFATGSLDAQRRLFDEARRALQDGNLRDYQKLEPQLVGYPLYPYLRYEYLRPRLAQTSAEEIHAFLAQHPDTPVATQLRRTWLAQLARRNDWTQYLADYSQSLDDDELRCHYANALIRTGRSEEAWSEVDSLWLSARSQPDECNPVFEAWRKADQMTRDKLLMRLELALDRKQTRLVSYLSKFLPKTDRPYVTQWLRMYRSPSAELKRLASATKPDPFWSAKLFSYGVRRLAGQDAVAADRHWGQRDNYQLTPEQALGVERAIALNLAMQRQPDGYKRLAALAENGLSADHNVRQWRVRSALWHQDWEQVLTALSSLTGIEQAQEDWQYWRARALEALGRKEEAEFFYHIAAQHRSFYGFLAAARVGRAPNIVSESLGVTEEERAALEQSPAMRRMNELSQVGMTLEARREWRDALDRMDGRTLRVAAQIAHDQGAYDQAIMALGRTEYLNDLEVRFPTPYRDQVESQAEKRNLDPAFVYALMRQESAFGEQARSRVGALGLMQLMPATARRTARSIKERAPSRAELLRAENNIRIGTAHLSKLLDGYDGNRFFALAAYNAGPQRVVRWQPQSEPMPADIWVANVTFAETRDYIERILAYTAVYEWRLGRSITPVTDWLADAPPRLMREASSGEGKPTEMALAPPG